MKRVVVALILAYAITVLAQPSRPTPQWEYKFVYQCDEKKTNNIAAEGWELTDMSMTAYGSVGAATCVFKRPK